MLTFLLEVWQLRQDWVVLFLRLVGKKKDSSEDRLGWWTLVDIPFAVVDFDTEVKVHDFALELERWLHALLGVVAERVRRHVLVYEEGEGGGRLPPRRQGKVTSQPRITPLTLCLSEAPERESRSHYLIFVPPNIPALTLPSRIL